MFVIGGSIAVLALAGLLAWARLAPAQAPATPPRMVPGDVMPIIAQEGVEVRSGPSASFYPTSKLRYGDKVKVAAKNEKANPGWLAIEPPPGSQSWINATFVKLSNANPNQGIVFCDENAPAPVKPASSLTDQEPNVESIKVARGTQVVILGPALFRANAAWLPIQSPPGDVRYIPESAVATTSAVQTASANTTGFVAPPGGDQSPLAEADAAMLKAKQLFEKAAQSADPNQRAQALARLQSLQQMPASLAASQQPGYPSNAAVAPPRVALGGAITPAQTTSGSTALYPSPGPTGPAQWGKWGTLRKTAFQKDGQPMYRLEDERGTPLGYAIAAPGLTLEPHVGRMVCLYGTTAYRSDDNTMRGTYTIVSTAAYPPNR